MGGGRGDGIGCAILTVEAGPEPEKRGAVEMRLGRVERSATWRGQGLRDERSGGIFNYLLVFIFRLSLSPLAPLQNSAGHGCPRFTAMMCFVYEKF